MDILKVIAEVGFPIACVLAMGIFIYEIYKQSVKREEQLNVQLEENRKINAKAIETIALYANRLDTIQEDIKDIKTDIISLNDRLY